MLWLACLKLVGRAVIDWLACYVFHGKFFDMPQRSPKGASPRRGPQPEGILKRGIPRRGASWRPSIFGGDHSVDQFLFSIFQ